MSRSAIRRRARSATGSSSALAAVDSTLKPSPGETTDRRDPSTDRPARSIECRIVKLAQLRRVGGSSSGTAMLLSHGQDHQGAKDDRRYWPAKQASPVDGGSKLTHSIFASRDAIDIE